jgi:CheY-like chemotaxis protein
MGAKPTFLAIEDDALLRMHAAVLLDDNGFGVVEAKNADAALKMLETRDDVQLLFTDIRMAARATDWTWRERFTLVGRAFFWSSPPVT